ncbi:MAG: hypothetical protein CMA65_00925 [Euryarchaeota archaeon]|mgnify:FL=1|nr:hypothetical protein [Euryarchaeota archaeon]
MKSETVFWLFVTVGALVATGALLGYSDGTSEVFSTADEIHPLAQDCLGGHGDEVEHYHTELIISVNNEFVEIPGDVGLNDGDCTMRQLHTHSTNGVIHIEMKEQGVEAPLEAFFDVWGKHFDKTGFDDYRVDADHELLMFVTTQENGTENREQVTTFETHILENNQKIELVYREKA